MLKLNKYFRNHRFKVFEIILVVIGLTLITGIFFLLFRTKKYVVVTLKVNEDNVVWPNQGVSSWFGQLFHPGMEEKSSLGNAMAKVEKVRSYDSDVNKKTVYLTIKLDSTYSQGTHQYTYKGKIILIGSTLQLYLDKIYVEGLIVDVEGVKKPYPQVKLILNTQLINSDNSYPDTVGVMPFFAENINIGDSVKDNKGNDMLKIVDKTVDDADRTVTTADGRVFLQKDPVRKDVYLTFEILADKIGGQYYFFGDIPITIGGSLPVHLDNFSFWPTITKITVEK